MGHYQSNTRDQEFWLDRVFPATEAIERAWPDFDPETVHGILDIVADIARGPLADAFVAGDRTPPVFDPATFSVTVPQQVKDAYAVLMESGVWQMDLPEGLGGSAAPPSLRWAAAEIVLGAEPSLFFFMAGPLFASILFTLGNADQKRLAQLMVDHQWGATMVLTEPDAGSDVGAGITKAYPNADGTWRIEGVKRFITSGDHDLADNIVHLVLARPVGVEGVGGPGTKGLSLFAVPKFHVDLATGELGDRNGAFVTGMEHKHGLTASPTCEVSFGLNGVDAVGTLVGDVHDGIAQMFRVIEYARMMVGTKSIATLSTAYLGARDYARDRIQGSAVTGGKDGPKVPIIDHPDVKRMLLLQKAYAEGMRALVLYTARWQDRAEAARRGYPDAHIVDVSALDEVGDLLLPIVKGLGSERSYEMLTLALQTYGGSGYLKDYPVEQHLRNALIDRLYEGTTGIQGMDYVFRKILKNRFAAWGVLLDDLTGRLDQVNDPALADNLARVKAALEASGQMLGLAAQWAMEGISGNPDRLNTVAFNTTRILLTVGDTLVGAFLLLGAQAATGTDQAQGRAVTADFYARQVLPRVASELASMLATTDAAAAWMALPVEEF